METPRTFGGAAGLAASAVAGGISALLFAFAFAHAEKLGAFFAVYLTPLPLFMAGLGAGGVGILLAAVTGVAGLLIGMPSNLAVLYTFIFAVPSIIVTALSMRHRIGDNGRIYWYPEGFLLTALTLYPCVIFLGAIWLFSSHQGGLLGYSLQVVGDTLSLLGQNHSNKQLSAEFEMMRPYLEKAVRLMPAAIGSAWVIVMGLALHFAQVILKNLGWNLRDNFTWKDVHTPRWLLAAFALAILGALVAASPYDYYCSNLGSIFGLPFFATGLAVVHAWAATTRAQTFALVVFYLVLTLVMWMAFPVTLLGVADHWADFRRRWLKPKPSV